MRVLLPLMHTGGILGRRGVRITNNPAAVSGQRGWSRALVRAGAQYAERAVGILNHGHAKLRRRLLLVIVLHVMGSAEALFHHLSHEAGAMICLAFDYVCA